MFESLGRRTARHPVLAVVVWVLLTAAGFGFAVVGVGGENLFDRLSSGEPSVPGSESERADRILAAARTEGPSLTLLLERVDAAAPGLPAALATARADLAAIDGVATVTDPTALPGGVAGPAAAPLVAADGDGVLVVVALEPDLDEAAEERALDAVQRRLERVPADLAGIAPDATGVVGGAPLIVEAITDQVEEDLATGEAIALPVALLVMVFVFGGLLAAAMPMVGAVASIAGGLGALLGFSHVLDLDSSVVNVVTLLGLGLSIDYGLLMVSRFREELHALVDAGAAPDGRRRGPDPAVDTAIVRTMATAGRTVAYSALTVAISIAGLLLFRPDILRGFGAAGVAVIVVAVATALTLVPAMLVLVGRRLLRPGLVSRVPVLRRVLVHTADVRSEEGMFSRLAARVQRRPWTVLAGVLLVLGVMSAPLAHLQLRNSTIELLPVGTVQREYVETLAADYPAAVPASVVVVADTSLDRAAAWAADLAALDGVAAVDPPVPAGSSVVLGVRPTADDAGGAEAQRVVREVRALDPGFPTWVTGQAAGQIDFVDALTQRAPWAGGLVVVATFVLLFLMTGSVVVPVKALLANIVSLAASLGVLVWVFQDGHLSGLLDFVPTGGIETYVVALVVAFAFGLAMDYEVFLLSRIKELHDAGVPSEASVRLGLQRSGRIITSAAAIVVVVFTGFVFGELLVIKEVGFSLAVAVIIDATLVRLLLVPATMTLLGRRNWWAPEPLRRLHRRVGIAH